MSEAGALALYDEILQRIGERATEIHPRPCASHWPHVGTRYRAGGLLIAGQALQGWDRRVAGARWVASEASNAEGRAEIIHRTRTWFADAAEPVGVIAELGNRARSPFWTLARDVTTDLAPGVGPWYSHVAWANVYPVSFDYGLDGSSAGSPFGALKRAQDPLAGRLFEQLVDMLDPARVLVIAGPNYWHHTAAAAGLGAALEPRELPLMASGRHQGRTWLLGYHPTYARRKRFTASGYATRIVAQVQTDEASTVSYRPRAQSAT